jgi:hypothetical protein
MQENACLNLLRDSKRKENPFLSAWVLSAMPWEFSWVCHNDKTGRRRPCGSATAPSSSVSTTYKQKSGPT